MTIKSALDLIRFHEGCRLVPYRDTRGVLTCGWGCTGDDVIEGEPWTQDYADTRFAKMFLAAQTSASADVGPGIWSSIDEVRRAVMLDMAYELGGAGLCKFDTFLDMVRARDWPGAAADLVTTKLYAEVPNREKINCKMLVSDQWPQV